MPADVDVEAWCDEVIVEDSDSMEKVDNRMVAVAGLAGPAVARTSAHDAGWTTRRTASSYDGSVLAREDPVVGSDRVGRSSRRSMASINAPTVPTWANRVVMPQPPPDPCLPEGIDSEGPGNELTVERRAPSSGVDSIHCQGVVIRASPDELRQPREPGAARPAKVELGPAPAETGDVVGCKRPRPDRAHVAAKNIDELRQLIEARGAEQPSHPCDPAGAHRSELQDVERAALVPDPFLPKDHRPTVIDQHRHRDHRHHRGKHRQSGQGPGQVEHPLRP
jgi:hypothetical protein